MSLEKDENTRKETKTKSTAATEKTNEYKKKVNNLAIFSDDFKCFSTAEHIRKNVMKKL